MNAQTLKQLIADDAYAATFQNLGQYRSALLAALSSASQTAERQEIDASAPRGLPEILQDLDYHSVANERAPKSLLRQVRALLTLAQWDATSQPEAPALTDVDIDMDIDNPPPLYPITWEQVKPYAIDWLLPDENLFEKENRNVLRFAQGLLADFASPDAQAIREAAMEEAAKLCNEADKSAHPAELADRILALKSSQAPQPAQADSPKKPAAEPDWSNSKTGPLELWKNPLYPLSERLQIADGAVRHRDEIIANLRSQLAAITQPAAEADGRIYERVSAATAPQGLKGAAAGSLRVAMEAEEREEAPSNNLPSWSECAMRVENSDFIAKRVAEGGYGPEAETKLATELHRFIYEYDDANPYRSAWFLHRLEKLLDETRHAALAQSPARQDPTPSICHDKRFMAALDSYMDTVTNEPRNTDRRINQRLEIFAAADAWHAAKYQQGAPE